VVTADGHFVRAAPDENDDLFWALRGGGGNFGVVTEFEFQLHPVDRVVGGPMLFEASAAQQVASFYRDYIAQAPRELGAFLGFQLAPPLPFIPEHRHLDPMCLIVACWSGPPDEAEQALAPLRGAGPVVAELVGPMPYPALQAAFDALVPRGLQHYWKADFVAELTDEAIGIHAERGATVPCVNSAVHLYPIDGAVHDVPDAATAFAHRRARFALNIAGIWPDPNDNATNIAWVRDYYAAVHPHSGYEGGYTNFGAGDDDNRVKANYGASYEHLAEVKRRWDPGNLFRLNQNVEPSSA
jgi:FAD/FMN-containing dehydrogenase